MKDLKFLCEYLKIECKHNIQIKALNSLRLANNDELSFALKNNDELAKTKAAAVLVNKALKDYVPQNSLAIVVDDAKLAFAKLSKLFAKKLLGDGKEALIGKNCNIMPNVYLGKNSVIGDDCTIMSGAFVADNVSIGNNCIIYPNVVIYNDTKIGNNCIFHANSVIGSDGFGYASSANGHTKIYHNGFVQIEDNVEIGACVCIDRAVFDKTLIKNGSKIDNLVQIGHNCEIGNNCIIVSQTGLAGSTKLGSFVIMGGQSATSGHLSIKDACIIAARGGVNKSLTESKTYGGFPIMEQKEWLKMQAKLKRITKNEA